LPFTQSFLIGPNLARLHSNLQIMAFEGRAFGVAMQHLSPSLPSLHFGESEPHPAGWCSVRRGEIQPTHQVLFRQRGTQVKFVTLLKIFARGQLPLALARLDEMRVELGSERIDGGYDAEGLPSSLLRRAARLLKKG
jgi:hypothetical protein